MQALIKTSARGAKALLKRPNADVARITRFAQHSLRADSATVMSMTEAVSVRRRRSVEQRLCELVVASDDLIAVSEAGIDPRFQSCPTSEASNSGLLGVPVYDHDGAPVGALCVVTDGPRIWSRKDRDTLKFLGNEITVLMKMREALKTEKREAEEQRTIAREYHHRVRNAYSVASAVVVLTANKEMTVQSLIETTSAQFRALADAHSAVEFGEFSADLSSMLERVLRPYKPSGSALNSYGPRVHVPEKRVVSLGLILNELATNSVKYGALGKGGPLRVRWSFDDGQVVLRWMEPCAEPQNTAMERPGSFGGTLVELSVSQIGGTLDRTWTDHGLEIRLAFPI